MVEEAEAMGTDAIVNFGFGYSAVMQGAKVKVYTLSPIFILSHGKI